MYRAVVFCLVAMVAFVGQIMLRETGDRDGLPLPAHPIIATMMQVTPDGILPSGMRQEGPWAPHDPNHREPPEGWVCMNPGSGVPKDHECDCAHKCVVAPPTQTSCDEDGENCTEYPNPQAGERSVQENAKCAVWCHPKHCGCKVEGCSTT